MIALGLTAADMKLFTASLSTHHNVKVTVQVLTLNHAYVGDLTSYLIDGTVSIDADAEVTRSLSAEFRDPDGRIRLDSTSPADGALYYDRMLRIIYSVKSDLLPRWVDVPIFCGPITKMSRTAEMINVEAQGKESLALPPTLAYYSRAWGKGVQRDALVRTIMSSYAGETKFSFGNYGDKTAGVVTLKPDSNIWALAKSVNGSFATRQLFYDGRGVLVMRSTPKTATYTFKTGVGGNVSTIPTIDYDISEVRNLVTVKGAIPKGKKTPVQANVSVPSSHILNPFRMGRNGRPRILYEIITDENIKTTAQAKALATARVNSYALQAVDVQFEALVAPHLEPLDIFTLKTPDFAIKARYRKATIPLVGAAGAVGFLNRSRPNSTRIRRR